MKKRVTLTPVNGTEMSFEINKDKTSVELIMPDYGVHQPLNKKEVEALIYELQYIEDELK